MLFQHDHNSLKTSLSECDLLNDTVSFNSSGLIFFLLNDTFIPHVVLIF